MTPSEITAIQQIIAADATAKELAKVADDAGLAAHLNAPTQASFRPLNSRELLKWSAANGRAAKIRKAAENALGSDDARSLAIAADRMLSRADTELDFRDETVAGFCAAIVQAGILAQTDIDALKAMAASQVGIAEKTIGRQITPTECGACR